MMKKVIQRKGSAVLSEFYPVSILSVPFGRCGRRFPSGCDRSRPKTPHYGRAVVAMPGVVAVSALIEFRCAPLM